MTPVSGPLMTPGGLAGGHLHLHRGGSISERAALVG